MAGVRYGAGTATWLDPSFGNGFAMSFFKLKPPVNPPEKLGFGVKYCM